jgi:hypothetical protein
MTVFIECHLGCAWRNVGIAEEKCSGELVCVPVKKTEEREKSEFLEGAMQLPEWDGALCSYDSYERTANSLPRREHGA